MGKAYALLRAGFPYVKTLGMRRITSNPIDLALGREGRLYILCRGALATEIRRYNWDDEDLGTIGGPGWSLALKGARAYGNPMYVRFQGVGIVSGEKWIYDYEGYLVPDWPNGVDQVPAIVGSVIRTIPHSGSQPNTVHPAGVVGSFYAGRAG